MPLDLQSPIGPFYLAGMASNAQFPTISRFYGDLQVTWGIVNKLGSRVCVCPRAAFLFRLACLVDCNLTISSFRTLIIFKNCIDLLHCSSGGLSFAIQIILTCGPLHRILPK